jgi:hypothetical protein
MMIFVFQGPVTNTNLTSAIANLTNIVKPNYSATSNYANWWQRVQSGALEPIIPKPWLSPISDIFIGGLPSVLVSREVMASGRWASHAKARLRQCIIK